MRRVFADTYYWIALLNDRDQGHAAARAISQTLPQPGIVTTQEVLSEVLTYFCAHGRQVRQTVAAFFRQIVTDPAITAPAIVPVVPERSCALRSPPGQGIQPDRLHFPAGHAPGSDHRSSDQRRPLQAGRLHHPALIARKRRLPPTAHSLSPASQSVSSRHYSLFCHHPCVMIG